jgi:D-glycero-alpha-D-manno-heptose-7-phosphate kinase
LKRNFSKLISNKYIEEIYEGAMTHGAKGGKLLGAGGGGFFLFYVPPFEKHQLMTYLKSKNIRTQSFRFEENGLKSWKKRETEDNLHKEKSDI